jgi:uncharacterized protein
MYFLDTSALAKRYVVELGSKWINDLSPNEFIVATIVYAEMYSAITRQFRGGSISSDDYADALKIFDYDMENHFLLIEVDKSLFQQAGKLAQLYPLRGYDSVQLACAIKANDLLMKVGVEPLTFLTADKALLKAAANEGLVTDNPESH